jgi:hypothetical protein
MNQERHPLTLRLPPDLFASLTRIKKITGQSITSQLIETAMQREVEFDRRLTNQTKVRNNVMNCV